MRRLLISIAAYLALSMPSYAANSTVSAMTAASALSGAELLYCVQSAADRKCTPVQLATYLFGNVSGDLTCTGGGACTLKNTGTASGPIGSTTVTPVVTTDAQGRITALTSATVAPAVGSVTGLGTGVATAAGSNLSAAGGLTTTIASGATAMGTGAISSAACATVVTATATGTATTDVLTASFNGDPTAVTGYVPATAGMLTIISYPTLNTANFKVCNNTSGSITPGAITLNWRVVR